MGLSILKTPFRAPQANAFCERLVGSIRRECLDFLIPLNERHRAENSQGVGGPLQQRPPTLQLGARSTRTKGRRQGEAALWIPYSE